MPGQCDMPREEGDMRSLHGAERPSVGGTRAEGTGVGCMRFTDIDWRDMLNTWPVGDIVALRQICDEKVSQCRTASQRKKAKQKQEAVENARK